MLVLFFAVEVLLLRLDRSNLCFILFFAMKSGTSIREWARQQGIPVNAKGRLPRNIVEHYAYTRFDVLAAYLEPHLDVYHYMSWTHRLRKRTRRYFLEEYPTGLWQYIFGNPFGQLGTPPGQRDDAARQREVDELLAKEDPFTVAYFVRNAAVANVPTLRELFRALQLNGLKKWPHGEGERNDVATWLEANLGEYGLNKLADAAHIAPGGAGWIAEQLSPTELYAAFEVSFRANSPSK